MSHVLIIGAGGVGSVVAHKCAQVPEVFSTITLPSRTLSKCEAIAASVKERTGVRIATEVLVPTPPMPGSIGTARYPSRR